MSRKLLIGMFVAVLAVGGFILFDRTEETDTVTDPLRAIDFASLRRIECKTVGVGEWTMKRGGDDRWTLTSPALADGKPVAADAARVQRIIGFLRDYTPHEQRPLADVNLAEWGLEPPEVELTVDDGGAVHVLHFGKIDVDLELFYRAADGDALFKVGAEVTSDLRIDPRHLRHPGLSDAPPHLVRRIEIERADDTYTLERVASRWFIVRRDGSRRRGDPSLCDQLATALAAASGRPVPGLAATSADPMVSVRLIDSEGGEHRYVIHGRDEQSGGLYAQRSDEPDLRLISKAVRRWFERTADELVDPIFTGFEGASLAAIVLEGPGRPDRLELIQRHGRWFVKFYEQFAWRSDPSNVTRVRDELLALRVDRYVSDPGFDPAFVARFSFDDPGAESLDVVVEVSAPRADGTALARRSDEVGAAVIPRAELAAFGTRYWDVMARDVCTGNDESIDRLAIKTRDDGKTWGATRTGGGWETASGDVVASEFLTGLLGRVAYLSVADYLGELGDDAETAAALDDPVYEVTWRHPEPNSPDRPTPDSPGVEVEKWWKLVRRLDDTRFACVCSIFPRLVFAVDAQDLTVIEDALRGLRAR